MRIEFHGLKFNLPPDWAEITQDLPEKSPPSLARSNGVGVVQFSFAQYRSGEKPHITMATLRKFQEDFSYKNNLLYEKITEYNDVTFSIEGNYNKKNECIIVRYFSNGNDVLLVTYVCPDSKNSEIVEDLKGVSKIFDSMVF